MPRRAVGALLLTVIALSALMRPGSSAFGYPGAQTLTATPTPVQRPGGRFEESDPRLHYSGAWTHVAAPEASGGAVQRATARGAAVEFVFPGSEVKWVTTRGPDRGIAQVFIDDHFRGTIDLYAAQEQFQSYVVSYLSLASDQSHTLRIVVTGERRGASSGSAVDVDAFIVGAAEAPDTLRFEDTDPSIRYSTASAGWSAVREDRASGGSVRRATQAGAVAELAFTGPTVLWFTSRGPDRGIARVTIDDVVRDPIDLYRSTVSYQETFLFENLSDGPHTIRIEATGTRSGSATASIVDVDAFVVSGAPTAPAPTPPIAATATRTPAPTATAAVTAAPSGPSTAPPAPAQAGPRDARYFSQTSFRVDDDFFWDYFVSRGGVSTFGYPVSRTFPFLGCTTQFFQRHVLQRCEGTGVRLLNLMDPDLMPGRRINGATVPAHDPALASAAPAPDTVDYSRAVLAHLVDTVPSTFEGLPVDFFATYMDTVPPDAQAQAPSALSNLEIWGFPTSAPAFDPANRGFVYQRFQRGIMHFRASAGSTDAVLLGDYFKALILGRHIPADLFADARDAGSRFLSQHCPDAAQAVCRPSELPGTDLRAAFDPQ